MKTIRVRIINNTTGEEEHCFNVQIDRSSDAYLIQLGITNSHVSCENILPIADNEYVLGLIQQHEGCQIVVG